MVGKNNDTLDADTAEAIASGFVSSSGKVLGGLVTLPESLAIVVNAAQPWIIDEITKFGADPVRQGVTATARALKLQNAEKIGNVASKGFSMALPYTLNVGELVTTAKIHINRKRELLESIAPLLSANKATNKTDGVVGAVTSLFDSGYSDNKMIATALEAVRQETYNNLSSNAVRLLPSIANNYSTKLRGEIEVAQANHMEVMHSDDGKGKEIALAQSNQQLHDLEGKSKKFNLVMNSSGVVTDALNRYLRRDGGDKVSVTSFGKVRALSEFIRSNGLDGEGRMSSRAAAGQVAEIVADIFQTYQKEQGHGVIPSHRLRDVSHVIAGELVGGDMHALSLVNIIGKELLLNGRKDGLVSTDKVTAVLKEEVSHFSKASTITSQEFLENAGYTLDDVKAHLQSKDKDERALAVVLHPKNVLLEAGLKEAEYNDLIQHFSKRTVEGIYSKVLGDLNQQDADQLSALGLDGRDLRYLEEHEGQPIQAGLRNKANEALVKRIVSKALVGEESTAWRDAITAGKEYASSPAASAAAKAGERSPMAPRGPKDYLDRNQGETYR